MRCILAAVTCRNGDTARNLSAILAALRQGSGQADLILFGEAFLQGFDALTFDADTDARVAVPVTDPAIRRIRAAARRHHTAVSFGFLERDGSTFYSSFLTVGPDGEILDHYRRVSPGWKTAVADEHYREGDAFHLFSFSGCRIACALCGDLWYDENIQRLLALRPDGILYPVYTDYAPDEWNASAIYEYAEQLRALPVPVLFTNSFDPRPEAAKGGAAVFRNGRILSRLACGEAGTLRIDIPAPGSPI